jgi:uncharacterized protein (DUF4213/DUF364 family)
MKLIDDLLESVRAADCPVKRVCIGLHWTVVESRYTGIAHTYKSGHRVELESSGNLSGGSAYQMAQRLARWEPLEASLGLAALNSLIEPAGRPGNIFTDIFGMVKGKTVTVIGRFPLNKDIAQASSKSFFLEIDPIKGELPASACEEVIPESDIVVISATSLINKTMPRLLELCVDAKAKTLIVGPSTPMSNVLLQHGAHSLGGVRVTDADALISSVMQGIGNSRKLAGIEMIVRP